MYPSHGDSDVDKVKNLLDNITHNKIIRKYKEWAKEYNIEVSFVQNKAIFESSTEAVLFRLKFRV